MILITGATGFVGRRLLHRLAAQSSSNVRVLLRPGTNLEKLPRPIVVHTMIGDSTDKDSVLAAMSGVHTVIHLVGTESRGRRARLREIDVASAKTVLEGALSARVGRIIYVSRPNADRSSAFPVLKAKGEIEEAICQSGIAYTIVRTSALFGAGDRFSEHIALLASAFPFFILPGDGETVFQPLWVEDLVTCIMMSLEDLDSIDKVINVGGPELLTYRRIVLRVMHTVGHRRPLINLPLLINQAGVWFLDGLFVRWPTTKHWIEMFSSGQSSELGTVERLFGFRPAAFDVGVLSRYVNRSHPFLRLFRYILTSD